MVKFVTICIYGRWFAPNNLQYVHNCMSPKCFMEGDCAVCGQLVPLVQLSGLYDSGCDLDVLVREGIGVTHLERASSSDPILDETCTKICGSCKCFLGLLE